MVEVQTLQLNGMHGIEVDSRVRVGESFYHVLDADPQNSYIKVQPAELAHYSKPLKLPKSTQDTQVMKSSNIMMAVASALAFTGGIGESYRTAEQDYAHAPNFRSYHKPNRISRNKLGSHKQTMRKLGKLK